MLTLPSTDDIIYLYEPYFLDGVIARAASRMAEQRNIPYFSGTLMSLILHCAYLTFATTAALNYGKQSYEADFVASSVPITINGGTCLSHRFGTAPDANGQIINAPNGARIFLQWTDPFFSLTGPPGALNNIDLLVFDAATGDFVLGSFTNNINGDPVAFVEVDPGRYILRICARGRTVAPLIRLKWINIGPDLTEIVPDTQSSTSFGHPNARNTAGVAAAWWQETPEFGFAVPLLEPYSSRGGTPILLDNNGVRLATPEIRQQPRFTAVDGTSTTFFGSQNRYFFGTSAAAPNCAAIALLMLQANPGLTPAQVYNALASTAIDMETAGYDFDSGAGLVDAYAAVSLIAVAPSSRPSSRPSRRPSSRPSKRPSSSPSRSPIDNDGGGIGGFFQGLFELLFFCF
jgi:subtilisin family serine protease